MGQRRSSGGTARNPHSRFLLTILGGGRRPGAQAGENIHAVVTAVGFTGFRRAAKNPGSTWSSKPDHSYWHYAPEPASSVHTNSQQDIGNADSGPFLHCLAVGIKLGSKLTVRRAADPLRHEAADCPHIPGQETRPADREAAPALLQTALDLLPSLSAHREPRQASGRGRYAYPTRERGACQAASAGTAR